MIVEIERPVVAGGRRYVPDLKVSCCQTGRPLLLIEVWHTHAVSPRKRRAYNAYGLPWVEVRSWHVLHRYRKRPLPILDWGGAGMPDAPFQGTLFGQAEPLAPAHTARKPKEPSSRRARDASQLPPATLPVIDDRGALARRCNAEGAAS